MSRSLESVADVFCTRGALCGALLLSLAGCGSNSTGTGKLAAVGDAGEKLTCNLKTGYPGDDTCLVAPAPGTGLQFHYGPSDYSNPDEVSSYVLPPGQEIADCLYFKSSNTEKMYFRNFETSMRPGFHHLLVHELPWDVSEGHKPACSLDVTSPDGGGAGGIPRLVGGTSVARGVSGTKSAPEDEGLADYVGPNAQIEMAPHFLNSTTSPILMEVWMNMTAMDPSQVKQVMEPVEGYGDVGWAIQPGAHETWRSSMTIPAHMRFIELYSHYHSNTVRMTAWRVQPDNTRTKLYESYNWNEPGVIPLNSVDTNPAPDPTTKTTGGVSGDLWLDAGDKIEWECEVQNNRSVVLRYINSALNGEMCNVRSNFVPSAGQPLVGFDLGHKCTGPSDCPE
jgi:hypothetical protein